MDESKGLADLSELEARYWNTVRNKDHALRAFLEGSSLAQSPSPRDWFTYLSCIKDALGNLNNDISFVASLLVKEYLAERFGAFEFDAGLKPQGAPGIDVEITTADGRKIVGEIKTTKPYQPGFGAAQKASILKDLERLAITVADHRMMFVTDEDAFAALCRESYRARFPKVEVVNVVTGRSSLEGICATATE